MKLSVMQENLARGLSVVSRAVSNRSLPVLTNVLLKTEDAGLKLTATNLEIGITYWVPGKIEVDGATSVPARLLTDLVNSLPGGEPIFLELGDGETLHIRSGRFESNIKGISAEDFPTVQTAGERSDHPDPAEGPSPGARGDGLRGRERRGPPDPDRRPRSLRGRPADPCGRRQLPDRGQDDLDPRPGRRDERRHPGSCAPRAQPRPRRRRRPGLDRPRPREEPDPVPSRWRRPRQPADRRPVPELPVRAAGEPHDAGGPRSRGAPPRGSPGGADRPRVGEHRQARRRPRRRSRRSPSAPMPRSATTSAGSRRRSRATGRRSPSMRASWPTS